jgi:tripartite-type tricarboxylate transporter receptor subunit TctC
MADFNITDPEIIKMLKGLTEEARQDVADQIQESLDSGEVKKIIEDAKARDTVAAFEALSMLRELRAAGMNITQTIDDSIKKEIEVIDGGKKDGGKKEEK